MGLLQPGHSERQIETAVDLLHLVLGNLAGPLLSFRYGGKHEVLEHFDVACINHCWIDFDRPDLATTVRCDRHHSATTGARDRTVAELCLELANPGLDLLAHLKKLLEIRHDVPFMSYPAESGRYQVPIRMVRAMATVWYPYRQGRFDQRSVQAFSTCSSKCEAPRQVMAMASNRYSFAAAGNVRIQLRATYAISRRFAHVIASSA